MKEYNDDTYGESIAEKYDTWFSGCDLKMIECIFGYAKAGKVLELGIGTGRVAIPLKDKYVEIHGIKMNPIKIRYAWTSEIDLKTQLAGLKLVSRWSDWQKSCFSSNSERHISIYSRV
jgi:hypothetical protein